MRQQREPPVDPKKFARIAESLRQYRRADLRDFDKEVGARPIEALYVDPLPNNAVLNSVLSTCFSDFGRRLEAVTL